MTKTFTEASPPPHSPWGQPQSCSEPRDGWDRIAPGIYLCCTPSHGGYWLSPERHAAMPTDLRELNFLGADSPFFEEDCSWALVAVTFPDCFNEAANETAPRAVQWQRDWKASAARERVTGRAAA